MSLRIAVIGAGHMGSHHARKVAELARADGSVVLAGVADMNTGRAERLAQECGAQPFSSLEEVLPACDALIVAVPTVGHYDVVSRALDAGIDVLVEKPIAASLGEAEVLLEQAQQRGRVIRVGHLEWFNAAMRRVRSSIDRPRFIEAHRMGPFPGRATDVDVVRDLMIHDLDIVQRLVGEEPERVEAIGVPVLSGAVDIANARLNFAGGCVANMTASRVSPTPMRKIRFFQPDGYFSIDFLEQSVVIARRTSEAGSADKPQISVEQVPIDRDDALLAQLRHFRDAVRERKLISSAAAHGIAALRTALRINDVMPPLEGLS